MNSNHGKCEYSEYSTTIQNGNCLQKESEMNIIMHKELLERFHLNGDTIGCYPEIQNFVFSYINMDSCNDMVTRNLHPVNTRYIYLIIILVGVLSNS